MVAIIAGWKAELLKAIRQAVDEGHFKPGIDAQQMVFEIYGLMLAMHQDARLLRSADSARRARTGLARVLAAAAAEAGASPNARARARGALPSHSKAERKPVRSAAVAPIKPPRTHARRSSSRKPV
jgi:hypothetical protein